MRRLRPVGEEVYLKLIGAKPHDSRTFAIIPKSQQGYVRNVGWRVAAFLWPARAPPGQRNAGWESHLQWTAWQTPSAPSTATLMPGRWQRRWLISTLTQAADL